MNWLRLPALAASLLAGIATSVGATLPTVPTPVVEPVGSIGASGLLQAGLGLAMVLALIFLCAWGVRRLGLHQSGGERLLKVVSSVMVGQRERVVVVEIGQSWLVLGVAAGQVRALHSMPAESRVETKAIPVGTETTKVGAFAQTLSESLGRLRVPRRQDG